MSATPPSAVPSAGRPLSVLLAGGGSAGHVSPLLALADCLRRRDPATGVLALGTAEGLEARLVPERGYRLALVPRVPLPRRPSTALLRLPGRLLAAVRAAERAIREAGAAVGADRADVVVGVGGYVAVPAYLAARRLGVPVVVHEANFRPGVANRLGARLTRHVATTFPGTDLRGRGGASTLTGLPMRTEVTRLDRAAQRAAGRAAFGLDPDAPTLLVFGGSLGAQRLNTALAAGAAGLLAPHAVAGRTVTPQVLHLTGAGKGVVPQGLPEGTTYRAVEFTGRMDLAYAAADLALCRAGAGTVCETTAVGLPAVYVPLPVGNGEQRLNAAGPVAAGAALLVDDADVTPEWVRGPLRELLTDTRGALTTMTVAARTSTQAAGARDGDERLADLVEVAAGRRAPLAAAGSPA